VQGVEALDAGTTWLEDKVDEVHEVEALDAGATWLEDRVDEVHEVEALAEGEACLLVPWGYTTVGALAEPVGYAL
jgi:hypothetical protein